MHYTRTNVQKNFTSVEQKIRILYVKKKIVCCFVSFGAENSGEQQMLRDVKVQKRQKEEQNRNNFFPLFLTACPFYVAGNCFLLEAHSCEIEKKNSWKKGRDHRDFLHCTFV